MATIRRYQDEVIKLYSKPVPENVGASGFGTKVFVSESYFSNVTRRSVCLNKIENRILESKEGSPVKIRIHLMSCLPAGLALALLVIVLASPVFAQDRIASEIQVNPKTPLNDSEKRSLSIAAGQLLRQVHEARSAIKYQTQGKGSSEHVQNALKLVDVITNALPEYDLITTIKSGTLTYHNVESTKQFMVPVYGELNEMFAPFSGAARVRREASDLEKFQMAFKSTNQSQPTNAFLDIRDAKYYLDQAATALIGGDYKNADKSLAELQNHVVREYNEADLPLSQARWNLMEAARLAAYRNYDRSKENLQKAAAQLEAYKSGLQVNGARTAQTIIDDINNVAEKISQKKEESAIEITGIWEKLVNSF
jgi:hypothetical protein